MYKAFYGFEVKPFSKTPDPRFLYMSPGHREALARLEYAVEESELALLTGEIGCGKTTLSRALMDRVGDRFRFCYVINPRLSADELLRVIAAGLEVTDPSLKKDQLLSEITDALFRLHCDGKIPVVVIDEAQLIPGRELFDEIRLLTNFQLDDKNLISVILMGQPELRTTLTQSVYEPFRQRISLQFHLLPLDLEETQEYLDFRLTAAGGAPGLFAPDAVQRIFELSGGVPRRINTLATHALLAGFGRDAAWIDADLVDEAAGELLSQ